VTILTTVPRLIQLEAVKSYTHRIAACASVGPQQGGEEHTKTKALFTKLNHPPHHGYFQVRQAPSLASNVLTTGNVTDLCLGVFQIIPVVQKRI